jgi:hypothetical protein
LQGVAIIIVIVVLVFVVSVLPVVEVVVVVVVSIRHLISKRKKMKKRMKKPAAVRCRAFVSSLTGLWWWSLVVEFAEIEGNLNLDFGSCRLLDRQISGWSREYEGMWEMQTM